MGLLHIVLAESAAVIFKIKRITKQFKKHVHHKSIENLLHMLLFWVLILLDSYACSYKNRGCRMRNSPFLVSIITLPLRRSTLLQHITGQQKCKNKDGRKNIDRSMDHPAIQNASTGFF